MKNPALETAIRRGEFAIRAAVRDVQERRGWFAKALPYLQDTKTAAEVRQLIRDLDRLGTYGTLALSRLPEGRVARAMELRTALATILELGAD